MSSSTVILTKAGDSSGNITSSRRGREWAYSTLTDLPWWCYSIGDLLRSPCHNVASQPNVALTFGSIPFPLTSMGISCVTSAAEHRSRNLHHTGHRMGFTNTYRFNTGLGIGLDQFLEVTLANSPLSFDTRWLFGKVEELVVDSYGHCHARFHSKTSPMLFGKLFKSGSSSVVISRLALVDNGQSPHTDNK